MKPIVIPDVDSDDAKVAFQLPGGQVVNVLRLDYIDENVVDEMTDALTAQDVEAEVVAVANDLAAAKVGVVSQWQPLLDGTKTKLAGLGVVIDRVDRVDEVTAPTAEVVAALKPYSDQKPRPLRARGRDTALTMLKFVVTEDELALFEKMRAGQLDELVQQWRNHSRVTLGE